MPTVAEVFGPLVGKWAWQVKRGYGSFLTMEFGNPHLEIREPRLVSADALRQVRENFQRRRVTVVGDWHLWIQYCDWEIRTANHSISSVITDNPYLIDECLDELNGQILTSATGGAEDVSSILQFDLGGIVQISPPSESPDGPLWTLYQYNAATFALGSDGQVHQGYSSREG
jgi:hypothetical protein